MTQKGMVDAIARVLVDVPLAHLDRPFDYAVPEKYAETAVPGARVKVRFAGRDVDGFVLARTATSEHTGALQPLRRVVSAEPVLTPEIAALTAKVAQRYAGTRSDVLRLAIPRRHAATEKQESETALPVDAAPEPGVWEAYSGGPVFCQRLAKGESPRGVAGVLPGDDWAPMLAQAVVATARSGRGALVCVPDRRDLARLDAALTEALGEGRHVILAADAGPAKRYAAFLALSRGAVRIAIGTRAAAFAPVVDLGLVAIWDDGDDLFEEPRAPYPHAREVLLLRAEQTGCAALLAAYSRSVEAQYLVRTGWAVGLESPRTTVRDSVRVDIVGAEKGLGVRVPTAVHDVIRDAVGAGPVLVQTPRAGYAVRLACQRCRAPALCPHCHGPLHSRGRSQPLACAWCGTPTADWHCPECGNTGLRAPVVGDQRTAEELGRSFPQVAVRTSSGDRVLAGVSGRPALVVATPGAEPVAEEGYAAVVLLDTWLMLARADLRAAEEALRRWCNAAALVRKGGRVLAVGDSSDPALQALLRWDPAGFSQRETDERAGAHLPPAAVVATLTAAPEDLQQALAALALPPSAEVLGPVDAGERSDDSERLVIRVPRAARAALAGALHDLQAGRSTRKLPHVQVRVDPRDLG